MKSSGIRGAVWIGAVCVVSGACEPSSNYGRGSGDPLIAAESEGIADKDDTESTSDDAPEMTSESVDPTSTSTSGGGSSSSGDAFGTDDATSPKFATDVWPLLKTRCSCHVGFAAGGLGMDQGSAYEVLVDVASWDTELDLIEPGNLEESYLWRKLLDEQDLVGGEGVRMPMSGTLLTDEELEVIEAWILDGAPA